MNSPTQNQIEYVEAISKALHIDFPTSSKEFTKSVYSKWIAAYADEFKDGHANIIYDEDYLYEICINDVWCEHY